MICCAVTSNEVYKGYFFASIGVRLVSAPKRGVKFIVRKNAFRSVVIDLYCTSSPNMSAKFERKKLRTTNGSFSFYISTCLLLSRYIERLGVDNRLFMKLLKFVTRYLSVPIYSLFLLGNLE